MKEIINETIQQMRDLPSTVILLKILILMVVFESLDFLPAFLLIAFHLLVIILAPTGVSLIRK